MRQKYPRAKNAAKIFVLFAVVLCASCASADIINDTYATQPGIADEAMQNETVPPQAEDAPPAEIPKNDTPGTATDDASCPDVASEAATAQLPDAIGLHHPLRNPGEITQISAGSGISMVLMSDGGLWSWGSNFFGQLGDGTTDDRAEPMLIMRDVVAAQSAAYRSAALQADGSLWEWGVIGTRTYDGTNYSCIPQQIMQDVQSFSIGRAGETAVIKTDGSLWTWGTGARAWGGAYHGEEVGITHPRVPTKVMEDVLHVSTDGHTMFITQDGTLWGWGPNHSGELGNGREMVGGFAGRSLPPIAIMQRVVHVYAGNESTFAIVDGGYLWAWGFNRNGVLGDGTRDEMREAPVFIMDRVVYAINGYAIRDDGSLWAWGSNLMGELGDGTTQAHLRPVRLMDDVVQIAASSHRLALTADGVLWAWGHNFGGELGVCDVEFSMVPLWVGVGFRY